MAIFNHTNFSDGFSVIARCSATDVALRIDNRSEVIQRQFLCVFFGDDFYAEIAPLLASEEQNYDELRDKIRPALLAYFCYDWLKFSETIATETGGASTASVASAKQSNTKKAVEQYNMSVIFAADFLKWLATSTLEITVPSILVKKMLPFINY